MAEVTKRASNPRVGNAMSGGGMGLYLAIMFVELANKNGAELSDNFQMALAGSLTILCGFTAGRMTRDVDSVQDQQHRDWRGLIGFLVFGIAAGVAAWFMSQI